MNPEKANRELRTESLLLRPFAPADAAGMFEIYADPETMKYWSSTPVSNLAGAEKLVRKDIEYAATGKGMFWAVTLPDSRHAVGKCALFDHDETNRRAEIGYVLNRACWGKGIMLEAMTAVIDLGFGGLDLPVNLPLGGDTDGAARDRRGGRRLQRDRRHETGV